MFEILKCMCAILFISVYYLRFNCFIVHALNPVLDTYQTLNEIPRVHQNIHFGLISPVWSISQRPTVWTSRGSEWKTLHYSECQTSTHLIVSSNDISDMCDDSSNVAHDGWKLKESRRRIVLSLSNCVLCSCCTVLSESNRRLIVSSNSRHYKNPCLIRLNTGSKQQALYRIWK